MSKIIKVGIIGKIGSGKSEVAKVLRSMGANVLIADEINNELLQSDEYKHIIKTHFPCAVKNGEIIKSELLKIIFEEEAKRLLLMGLSHPKIEKIMLERTQEGINFYEIPLIEECNMEFDELWHLHSEDALRVKRIQKRSNISLELVNKISSIQGKIRPQRHAKIINNDYGLAELAERVEELYCELQKSL